MDLLQSYLLLDLVFVMSIGTEEPSSLAMVVFHISGSSRGVLLLVLKTYFLEQYAYSVAFLSFFVI